MSESFNDDQITRAIAQSPPTHDGAWSFADDPLWLEWIEGLSEEDANRHFRAGRHLPAVRRVRAALARAQGQLVRRERPLEMLVACAVAQVNLVFLGPPGTAKSLLVRTFAESLGVRNDDIPIAQEGDAAAKAMNSKGLVTSDRRLFEYLLTRYTTPEELFGGADINLLMEAHTHARRTTGMLPKAEIAFLDEIFKANSAILNTLLSLTNERIFYNMGQAFRVKLVFVVGASNESPDQHELGALFDRFPIRVPCDRVPDDEIQKVIGSAERFAAAKTFRKSGKRVPAACLNDIRLLSKVVACEAFRENDGSFVDQFCTLFLKLRSKYGISDRTPAQVLRVCRALALIESDPDVDARPAFEPRHLRAWGYIAPQFEEADVLQRFVQDHLSRLQDNAVDLFE